MHYNLGILSGFREGTGSIHMALKGNLRDFTITQLLNLINLARKTGSLVVQGSGESVQIFFREGKLAYAQDGADNSLATILFKAHKLSAAQRGIIQQKAGNISDKELGLLLINASYLSQQDILASLQAHFIEIVNHLFTWADGFFQFENDARPPDDKITVRLSLENLIIEGTRRMRELENLQDEIPSLDMSLKFIDRPGANLRNVNLSVNEWKVVSFINPKNTMRQIARAARLNDLEMRRIVYSLLQAGLVEVVRPEGAPLVKPVTSPLTRPEEKQEQVSLINRIIRRIRSL
jgi:hypothetical protein